MKKFLFISFIILGILYACEEEPAFPDPGFDATSDVVDTVRRDTIDTYLLKIDMKVPNGVKTIQILDGITYSKIEEIADYNGQKKVAFEYAIDLTSITDQEKTLYYIVKVIDNDLRTFNKAFSVTVKPFSEPTITYPVEGVLGVVSPVFTLTALFETGLYQMTSYKLSLGTEVLDQGTFDVETYEYDYSYVCNLQMNEGVEYTLTLELTDERGEVRTKEITVVLVEVIRPVKVLKYINSSINGFSLSREFEFVYLRDNPKLLDSISVTRHYKTMNSEGYVVPANAPGAYKFTHNASGLVESVINISGSYNSDGDLIYEPGDSWTYSYDENQRLLETRCVEYSEYDIQVVDWYADGRLKTYLRDPDFSIVQLDLPYYTNVVGEYVQAESWIKTSNYRYRTMVPKVTPIVMPSWYPALPSLLPYYNGRHEDLEILTMWRYGLEGIALYTTANGTDITKYTDMYYTYRYQTDVNGRIESLSKYRYNKVTQVDMLQETYYFVYE